MKILSIIPARGGSKGIKKKNIVEIDNKPLVCHSIDHAKESKLIDRIIVSTDDKEIAKISKDYGAEVPFKRPNKISKDTTLDLPVFKHALDYLERNENYIPEIIVHLRPTAPYRKAEWIDLAIKSLINNISADSVRSVSEVTQHPYRVFDLNDKGYLSPIMSDRHKEPYLLRRQELPIMYYYNSVIDVTRNKTINKMNSMTGKYILPFIIGAEETYDIDTIRDLQIARLFLTQNNK